MGHCVLRWLVPLHACLRTHDKAYWRVVVGFSADTVLCELVNYVLTHQILLVCMSVVCPSETVKRYQIDNVVEAHCYVETEQFCMQLTKVCG